MLLWRSLHAGRRLATASVPCVCCCCRLAGPRRVADQVCRRRRRTLEPDIGHSPARFRCSFIFFLHVDRLSCELCGLPTPRNTSVHHCLRSRYQLTGLHSLLCSVREYVFYVSLGFQKTLFYVFFQVDSRSLVPNPSK